MTLCKKCTEPVKPGRVYCPLHSEARRLENQRSRNNRKAKGLCWACTDPAAPGRTKCAEHLAIDAQRTIRRKKRYLEEGRCYDCGRPRLTGGPGAFAYECPACFDHKSVKRALNNVY